MTAYYNDNDKYCAQWLRNLILEKLIAKGDVDDRSIKEVTSKDVKGYRQAHFFAGIGGWSLALRLAGWPDSREVWTGSCPCQPFSSSGNRKNFQDERHLWPEWLRLIKKCNPAVIFGEQVTRAVDWVRLVRSDLARMGFAVGCLPIQASCAGAPHARDRFYFVGNSDSDYERRYTRDVGKKTNSYRKKTWPQGRYFFSGPDANSITWVAGNDGKKRATKSDIPMLVDGVSERVAKIKGFGNAIVPQVAAEFIKAFMDCKP